MKVVAVKTITCNKPEQIKEAINNFITDNFLHYREPLLYMSGENGDNRLDPFYEAYEAGINSRAVLRFKHLSGEYGTASGFALWAAYNILKTQKVPTHVWKYSQENVIPRSILIYNNHKGIQHSFMMCSAI